MGWNSRDKKNLTTAKNDNPGNGRRKFTCPTCGQNAWAKATAELICGACHKKNPTDVLHMIIAQ